jgi:AAA+ superfamily predicted ATPase
MGRGQLATAAQLRALLESYAGSDSSRFLSVATQIAAQVARGGDQTLADQLAQLVVEAKRRLADGSAAPGPVLPLVRPAGDLAGLVAASYSKTRLTDMVMGPAISRKLNRVVREYRSAAHLEAKGLQARRKLLLVGPPGCGKSMTAEAIAGELGRPLLRVQLHALIAKFMGETAAKLHLVFQAMERTPGVYLFDEFDSLGSHRGAENDVGEARRILNSFLLLLEQESSQSIIIAATNLPSLLDRALFRRFDDVVEYRLPTKAMIGLIIRNRLGVFDLSGVDWSKVSESAVGLSHGDIVRSAEDSAKETVLSRRQRIATRSLVRALTARRGAEAVGRNE